MKKILVMMFAGLIFTSIVQTRIFAQDSPESAIKTALTNLIEFSKTKSYDKASKLITFEDQNKSDAEKDLQVKRFCKKISALIDLSSKHEFGEFKVAGEPGKEIYNMQIVFISGDQKLITTFSFVKTKTGYLLSNMN